MSGSARIGRARGGTPPPEPAPDELDVVVGEPRCAEAPLGSLDSWITPTSRFFVRNHFPMPAVETGEWKIDLSGQVARPGPVTLADLREFSNREIVVTMECAGNSRSTITPRTQGIRWQHGAIGTARWRGVSLAEVLHAAGILDAGRTIVLEGADRGPEAGSASDIPYAMSLPREKALDPDTLLATEMNGAPLSRAHGAPVRAIVPGWYGMASVKWLRRIQVLEGPFDGFFRTESYVIIGEGDDPDKPKTPVTSLRVKSLITYPPEHAEIPLGNHLIRGIAWSGDSEVRSVEVSYAPAGALEPQISWTPATLLGPSERYAWRHWECPLEFQRPGYYLLRARATDAHGVTQPLRPSWNYRGVATNAVHAVSIVVRRPAV